MVEIPVVCASFAYLLHSSFKVIPSTTKCRCASFGCGGLGGKVVSNHLMRKHINAYFERALEETVLYEPINEWDIDVDLNLFHTHWSSKCKFDKHSTLLEFLFEVQRDFVSTPNATKQSVTTLLSTTKRRMADGIIDDRIPDSSKNAENVLEPFLFHLHKYHVCPNDCIIYRKQYENEVSCPVCKSSRYELDGKTALCNFLYYPITPRIRRMVLTKNICELLKSHLSHHSVDPFIQTDIQESKVWKEKWFGSNGMFSDVDIRIVLSLCLDGVNPFNHQHVKYSMWPIELAIVNFPPSIRKTSAGIMIGGLIPAKGVKEPEADVYMEILVEELISLKKCKMISYTGKPVSVSVRLLQYVNDYPAIGKALHFPGSAKSFRACPFCQVVGENCACNKTLFLQNRRYLPMSHPLRFATDGHVGNTTETRPPPLAPPTPDEVRELRVKYDALPNKNQKEKFTKEYGVKGCYPFMKLDYHEFHEDFGPDMMHTLKNAGNNISKVINGYIPRNKQAVVEVEKRGVGNVIDAGLTEEEINDTNEKLKTIIYPSASTGCKKSFITEAKEVYPTHAWHEYLSKNVMLYAIRDWSNEKLKRSLMFWLSVMNRLVSYKVDIRCHEKIKQDMSVAACLMERDFPLVVSHITTHFLLHEPDTCSKFGPVHSRWMFPFERLNSFISRRVQGKNHPKSSAMKTIQMADFVNDVILGNRLKNVSRDPQNNAEHVLMAAAGITPEEKKQKRKRSIKLSSEQKDDIEILLHSKIDEDKTTYMSSYRSKNTNEVRPIVYNSGQTVPGNFKKSSRFVYLKSEQRFGEIFNIINCTVDTKEEKALFEVNFFVHHTIDCSTSLPRAEWNSERRTTFLTLEGLSHHPLIVGFDNGFIYFISITHNSEFSWFSSLV